MAAKVKIVPPSDYEILKKYIVSGYPDCDGVVLIPEDVANKIGVESDYVAEGYLFGGIPDIAVDIVLSKEHHFCFNELNSKI